MGLFSKLSRYLDDALLPDEVRARAVEARARLEAGEPEEALTAAMSALAGRPDHPELLHLAGEALRRLGEAHDAESMLRQALELDDELPAARLTLGKLLAGDGRVEQAAEQLRRAAAQLLGSKDRELAAEALAELAACHRRLGRADRAARELRKAAALRPEDALVHAALARALAEDGEARGARAAATRALALATGSARGALLSEVGGAALAAGLGAEAVAFLRAAVEAGEPANLELAHALASVGDLAGAHEQALRALAEDVRAPQPHRLLADLARRAGDSARALSHLEAALALEPAHEPTLRRAVEAASRADLGKAGTLAEELLGLDAADPLALAVRARSRLARGERCGVAGELGEVTVRASGLGEAWLGLAELALAEGRGEEALDALERLEAADPARRGLDSLYSEACVLVATGGGAEEPDLYDVLERVHGLLAGRASLGELAVELGRLREDYDRPLLLTVMGEFNAGKSTFINALVGESVAPMGITPTTATINLLKYGTERRVRVLHTSGTVKEMEYESLGGWLKGLSRSAAVEVRQVEILYPAEVLTRVNLVDTPGFNSIVPEHEVVARRFIERADAVVWLFDAGQPGKDSERSALTAVTERGTRVLGVLNKADRLDAEALASVLAHVRSEGLGELLEDVVPLSARRALEAKVAGDREALEASALPVLEEALDRRFYSKAREIKRAGTASKLASLLEEAGRREAAADGEIRRATESLELARRAVGTLAERISADATDRVRRWLAAVHESVAVEAAEEVLEFVRPRRHLLDSHRFGPEDRAHLVELVEERLEAGLDGLGRDLAVSATETVATLLADVDDRPEATLAGGAAVEAGLELGRDLVWSLLVFHRGLARGGSAGKFFEDELPHLELDRAVLARRIAGWWEGHDAQVAVLVERAASGLARRLDALLAAEVARSRTELARRRRGGSRPLAGFAVLARRWAG